MSRRFVVSTILVVGMLLCAVGMIPTPTQARNTQLTTDYRSYADTAASYLYTLYNTNTGLWSGWWNSANQLTTMLNYMQHGGSNNYTSLIANTYDKNINWAAGQFRNNFLDDTGWWGLAWLLAFDKTRDSRYLNTAKFDADYMQGYWDGVCGGGVWWNTDKQSKNAITNELYIKLNAAYYNRTGDSVYLTRAQTGWNWFVNSGMINSQNLINDGLNMSTCQNNNDITWTYNQGVILGAAAELHRATSANSYLDKAQLIANAAMQTLIHSITGALREPCESSGCGADGPVFKGVFMRNLYELNQRGFNQTNKDFMMHNADVIWANDRSGSQFGLFWSGPYEGNDASRQGSALDAFNDAIQYSPTANLGLGRASSASGQCSSLETYSEASDGALNTKWCSAMNNGLAWLQVDLGGNNIYTVNQFVVRHAGAGGEDPGFNTRDFKIQGSSDAATWFDLATVTSNTSNVTTHNISNVGFRYYRLWITNPQTSTQYVAARIYEFEVNGFTNSPAPTFAPPTSTPTSGISSTAWYNVINQNSGKCVDGAGWGTTNGTKVVQWLCGTGYNQQWQFVSVGSGYFKVIPHYSSTLTWDVMGGPGATGDSTLVELWTYGGGTNQQWQAVALGGGYYKFIARNSSKCLEVPAWSTADGTQLTQYTCNGGANQAFRLVQQP